MHKLFRMTPLLAVCLIASQAFFAPACSAAEDDEARKAKILANLQLKYPQLEQAQVTMGDITPSDYEGLHQGTFSIAGGRGNQTQHFLVSADDTKLYLVSGEPLDVSRSQAEIEAEVEKRKQAEAKEASERAQQLAEAVADRPMRGNPDAPVLIVEFSDFQCPYCARGADTMEQLLEKHGDDVKLVFKHFPLNFHPWAKPASIAAHCAGKQNPDAFWTLHDKYFEHQKEINPGNVVEKSKEYLAGSGVDMAVWAKCAEDKESEEYKAAAALVDADMAFGQKLGVTGTPGFFVNGEFLSGAQPLAAFEPLIEKAKKENAGP